MPMFAHENIFFERINKYVKKKIGMGYKAFPEPSHSHLCAVILGYSGKKYMKQKFSQMCLLMINIQN